MKYLWILSAFVMMISSCNKTRFQNLPVTSLTVVNAVTGGNSVRLGSNIRAIDNNNSFQMTLNEGENDLYIWPEGDSAHPYYTYSKLNAADGGAYSLFLGGIPTSVNGILIKEDIPYRTDSTGGIRFINLSPNSPPLNISLTTTPSVTEVSNLSYKQYTDFKTYPGFASTVPYSFQIKNASNDAVLFTYSFNASNPIPRFSNISLVIRGLVGAIPGIGVTRVNNDR